MCVGGKIFSQKCPSGKTFSKEEKKCVKADAASNQCTEAGFKAILPECTDYLACIETNGKMTSQKFSCDGKFFDETKLTCESKIEPPTEFKSSDCKGTGAYPDTRECNAFHVCSEDGKEITTEPLCCPPGYKFSKTKMTCAVDDGTIECPTVSPCVKDVTFYCKDSLTTDSSVSSKPGDSSNTIGNSTLPSTCKDGKYKPYSGDCNK